MLPSYFNCEYNGTLIKGDNFGLSWVPEGMAEKMAAHYEKMGRSFAEKETFYKEEVNEFAAPEYFSEKEIRQYKHILEDGYRKHYSIMLRRRMVARSRLTISLIR